jgi:two-component system sensor histidine kinase BaeS
MGILFVVLLTFGLSACFMVSWLAGMVFAVLPGLPPHAPDPGTIPPWAGRGGPWVGLIWLAIGSVILGIFLTVRALRRTAQPLSDVMEAANRVEEGDYSTRVDERGPREIRNLARAFNSMTERLEQNDEQRRALLADVTHELRTPLTVMQGNIEAMLDGVYPRDDEHLAPILEETRVLSRLVEDLRTLSLAESGALKLHREPTDLEILITETLASFRTQADAAGIALNANFPAEIPPLDLDPVRVREVLANLIANAVRHTPPGGKIEVTAQQDAKFINVSVRDTGKGISPDALPYIFDRFFKSEQSRGMGLGLAIAKNLVVAHGGEITAESVVGGGTTIQFTLPVNANE